MDVEQRKGIWIISWSIVFEIERSSGACAYPQFVVIRRIVRELLTSGRFSRHKEDIRRVRFSICMVNCSRVNCIRSKGLHDSDSGVSIRGPKWSIFQWFTFQRPECDFSKWYFLMFYRLYCVFQEVDRFFVLFKVHKRV